MQNSKGQVLTLCKNFKGQASKGHVLRLDLCLKLLFSWTKSFEGDKRCCGWHLSQIHCHFVRFWEVGHPLITKKHARNTPIGGHTFSQQRLSTRMRANANAMPAKDACSTSSIQMCHHQRRWQLRALASFKYMLRARHREALVRSLNHLTKWCSPVCHIVTRMVRSWNYTCAMHTQPSNRLYSTCKEKWKRKTQTMPRDRRCTLAAGDAPLFHVYTHV